MSGQAVAWVDLTVPNAAAVRDFYAGVAGWGVSEVDMGGYADFTLLDEGGEAIAGVCHARGENADLPPVWIVYFRVAEIERVAERCIELGGEVLRGPSPPNDAGRTCFVRDPA
ncbi:MAG TPA: VOC family protein, partial [Gaiellaceae bacterium]|nr:VOC family protein [Gaiellaceae bacterium]